MCRRERINGKNRQQMIVWTMVYGEGKQPTAINQSINNNNNNNWKRPV